MNSQIPLRVTKAPRQGSVLDTLLVTGGLSTDRRAAHISAGTNGWFCVHDPACALLCRMNEEVVTVWCAVFSRRYGTGSIFSCAVNGELCDFARVRGPLSRSANVDVLQSSEDAIQNVCFIDQRIVIGTCGGELSLLDLPKDAASPMIGECVPSLLRPCSSDPCVWAFYPDAALCAGLTAQGLWVYRLGNDASAQPSTSKWQQLPSVSMELSAAAVCQCDASEEVTLVACTSVEHRVVVFTTDTALAPVGSPREYTLLDTSVDMSLFPRCSPKCYLHSMHNESGHLLAMVYPDSIIFCTLYGGEVTCSAALRNELNLTFESGSWTQHSYTRTREELELSVTRSDGACLLYSVVVEKGQRRFCELILNGYVILAHPACAQISASAGPRNACWLSVSGVEDMLSNAPGAAVQHTNEGGQTQCTIVNRVRSCPAGTVLLVEVVVSQGEFGLLTLLSTGDCLLVTQNGKVLVGTETPAEAQTVTSIYAFDVAGDQYGVVGRQDGSVKFFVNGRLTAYVHMAHTSAVNQLALLPAYEYGSGDVDDALVMSVCTQMGTVCLHSGTTGDVLCILCSPSRPLTGCFFDRKSQYMRTFSGNAGNLWHIPTCRLERTFTCAHQGHETGLDNLLHVRSCSSLRVEGVRFLGEMHFSIHLGVPALVASDDTVTVGGGGGGAEPGDPHTRDFVAALSLLLQSCQTDTTPSNAERRRALTTLAELGFEAHTLRGPLQALSLEVAPDTSGRAFCGLFAMLSSLISKRGDVALTAAAYQLAIALLAATVRDGTPTEQARALLVFYSAFFDNETVKSRPTVMARFGLQCLVSSVHLPEVLPLFDPQDGENWHLWRSMDISANPRENGVRHDTPRLSSLLHGCVLTILGLHCEGTESDTEPVPLSNAQQSGIETTVLDTVTCFEAQCQPAVGRKAPSLASTATNTATEAPELLARRLLPVAAGLPYLRRFVNAQELVGQMCGVVFGLAGSPSVLTDTALAAFDLTLQRAAAHRIDRFLSATVRPLYAQKPTWRVRIVVFLTAFIRNYPFEAYRAASALVEFAVGALDPQAPEKDEKALCTAAIAEMLRVAVATLPNVSFQQSLQQLAVGHQSGEIKVYSLRTAALVTTITSQNEPIMAVSYSSNTSSYDIAAVSESMTTLRLWRAAKPGSGITSFLTGYTVHFKCVNQVDLPPATISDASRPALLPLCTLKWLSPQCIWFISPWHGKIEMSMAH